MNIILSNGINRINEGNEPHNHQVDSMFVLQNTNPLTISEKK